VGGGGAAAAAAPPAASRRGGRRAAGDGRLGAGDERLDAGHGRGVIVAHSRVGTAVAVRKTGLMALTERLGRPRRAAAPLYTAGRRVRSPPQSTPSAAEAAAGEKAAAPETAANVARTAA